VKTINTTLEDNNMTTDDSRIHADSYEMIEEDDEAMFESHPSADTTTTTTTTTTTAKSRSICIKYHIVFSRTYLVPQLCFEVHDEISEWMIRVLGEYSVFWNSTHPFSLIYLN
jgi:hypothetical protein